MADIERRLVEEVRAACENGEPLSVRGGGTKGFLGRESCGRLFDVSGHEGIVGYDPKELVITARCGTTILEIEQVLSGSGQMLPFEPPRFGKAATLGGTVACGLSGPRRPYSGSVRDHLLGCRIVNGRGEVLDFGGKVMKNVAGFDASRLMAGAFGTLGVLLEVSLKVLPRPASSVTLARECGEKEALAWMSELARKPVPVDALAFSEGCCRIRLSGSVRAVSEAHESMGGEWLETNDGYWEKLREHELPFFESGRLWRITSRPAEPTPRLQGEWLIDWGGAQRWLKSDAQQDEIRYAAERLGGHATLFRGDGCDFMTLPPSLLALNRKLKAAFDPKGIFNPGRIHPGL